MKKTKILLLVAFVSLMSIQESVAQRFSKKKQYWSIGGSINAMNYVGDITASKSRLSVPFKFTRQNIGISAVRRISPRVSYRGNFFYGRMSSDDRQFGSMEAASSGGPDFGRYQRGASFVNTVYELSGTVIVDFFENRGTFQKRPDYTPYAFVGVGAFYHNPKDKFTKIAFKETPWGQFSNFQAAFLYGLGFRYKIDKLWDLALEIGWRVTTTDMLDGVKGGAWESTDGWSATHKRMYDKTMDDPTLLQYNIDGEEYTIISRPRPELTAKEAEKIGAARGNLANDGYIVTGLHLTRILGGKVICPKFR